MNVSTEKKNRLIQALLRLKDEKQAGALLDDLCTQKEIEDLADRLEVAQLLLDGETYEEITRQTGMSSTTIARINKALTQGQGYRAVLKKKSPRK